jgi:hypothetical protein
MSCNEFLMLIPIWLKMIILAITALKAGLFAVNGVFFFRIFSIGLFLASLA